MTFNQQLIAKARKGEIAIFNDGSVEELRKVITEVWPNDKYSKVVGGHSLYYYRDAQDLWEADDQTILPTHSVKEFFMTDTKDKAIEELKSDLEWMEKNKPQPRTYLVTRQQMKEIWQMLPVGADGEQFRNSLHYLFDPFENEAQLNHAQVKRIMKDFPEVQPSKLRSIFPEYFYIPEGEPVIATYATGQEFIRISNGKGGVYVDGRLSGDWLIPDKIIPFTKNHNHDRSN